MSSDQKKCFDSMVNTGLRVEIVTEQNVHQFEHPMFPIHPGFAYLSATHKSDYLRCYFMHVHGGAYSDVKMHAHGASWVKHAAQMWADENTWMVGAQEDHDTVQDLHEVADNLWRVLRVTEFICRPRTPLTQEWFQELHRRMDNRLNDLNRFPARTPQQVRTVQYPYPFRWAEILCEILHPIMLKYAHHLRRGLPYHVNTPYR